MGAYYTLINFVIGVLTRRKLSNNQVSHFLLAINEIPVLGKQDCFHSDIIPVHTYTQTKQYMPGFIRTPLFISFRT